MYEKEKQGNDVLKNGLCSCVLFDKAHLNSVFHCLGVVSFNILYFWYFVLVLESVHLAGLRDDAEIGLKKSYTKNRTKRRHQKTKV